ncbi:MAG: MobQ family relaxase [Methylobacter sp.]
MAIYHHKVKIISRSKGPGLIASAAYRAGEKIRDEKAEKSFDYRHKEGVLHSEIIAPNRSPDWVYERSTLWNTVEVTEKRKDSQLAREIMVALPAELNPGQRINLLRGYIVEEFIKKGMVADFVIHAPSKQGDDRNYHAHILLTMRTITSEGFGGKAREWNAKSNIYQWRQAWEKHTNVALEQAGLDGRVDCRSHADRELSREPQLHLGYQAMAIERSGGQSERGNENRAIEVRNAMMALEGGEPNRAGGKTEDLNEISQQPATPQLAKTEDSEDYGLDIQQYDIVLESFLDYQNNQLPRPSLEERKRILEQKAKSFEERKFGLTRLIENAPDEKAKDRLILQEKLESSLFNQGYHKMRRSLLSEEDPKKYVHEIVASQHMARKAGTEHQHHVSEWHSRAARDDSYIPIDLSTVDKINTIKAAEKKRWDNFAIKAEKNGWNPSRIEREKENLQKALDYELALSFGLERSLSRGR